MGFWLADQSVSSTTKMLIEKYHPHLMEARIAILFSDKRRVSGTKVILGTVKKVSKEDKVLSKFDFKMILSAEDWADLTSNQKEALLDHELNHCDVERVPQMEVVAGKRKPVKDKYGRTIFTAEMKIDEDTGKPKWKVKGHDFENFTAIAERYGLETAAIIGGYPPVEKVALPAEEEVPAEKN